MEPLDDLLIKRRRGTLAAAERRRVESARRASPEFDLVLLAQDVFDRDGAPEPADAERLRELVQAVERAALRPRTRARWRTLLRRLAPPLLFAGAAAASIGELLPRLRPAVPSTSATPSPPAPQAAQPSPAQPSLAQPSLADPSLADPSPAQPHSREPEPAPAQPSPAQPSPAQPHSREPEPAPAQPSPAHPSLAQPSPAHPSPAQPHSREPEPEPAPAPAEPSRLGLRSELPLPKAPRPEAPRPATPRPRPPPSPADPAEPAPAPFVRPRAVPPTPPATTSNPESAQTLFRRANRLRPVDWPAAAALYAELIQRHPDSNEAGVSEVALGKWSLAQGRSGDALEWFRAHLRRPPGALTAEALFGEARALESIGSHGAARVPWRRLLERYPASPYADVARQRLVP